jgi:hypothetical protein
MKRGAQLLRGGLLAATLALACGTDTIELLPPRGEAGGPPAGGSATSGAPGEGASGSTNAGMSGSAAAGAAGSGGSGGSFAGGGTDMGGCSGLACGGFGNFTGAGGDGSCDDFHEGCPCGPQDRCDFGLTCNTQLGTCLRSCINGRALTCGTDELLCRDSICQPCGSDPECVRFGAPGRERCVKGRCQECATTNDCYGPDRCVDNRCIQCMDSNDCVAPTGQCFEKHCVECAKDEDCPSGKCEDFTWRCVK